MIVLSAGMQKAGSAWLFNMTNDLVIAAGHEDIRRLRDRFFLAPILTEVNCNMGTLHAFKLLWVSVPHLLGKSYVIKTHEGPTWMADWLMDRGSMRSIYIFRDPRDVAVSAFEHGKRIRDQGIRSDTGFDHLMSMEAAIRFAAERIPVWEAWRSSERVQMVRYEDLRADALKVMCSVVDYLGLDLPDAELESVVARYQVKEDAPKPKVQGLHFDKGVSGRWQEKMTNRQVEMCKRLFGEELQKMGYE
jgi:hypothetical protein